MNKVGLAWIKYVAAISHTGARPVHSRKQSGYSLLELLITLAVLAVIITAGVPTFLNMLENSRATSAAQETYALLQYARSDALRAGETRYVVWQQSEPLWCVAVATTADCDCLTETCAIDGVERRLDSEDFGQVSLVSAAFVSGSYTAFDGLRGLAEGNAGTVTYGLNSAQQNLDQSRVVVSTLGRVRMCQTGAVSGGLASC